MYFKLSFVFWRKLTEEEEKRRQWNKQVAEQRELYKTLGKNFVEPEYFQMKA